MKTGIVLEGGAFRTIFSCGVMDAFLEKDIMPDYMIGVSAGAAYGVSYPARQEGRNLKIILNYCQDPRYMGMKNFLDPESHSYYGLDFAYNVVPNQLVRFDYEAFDRYPGDFYAVITNVLTGEPEYRKVSMDDKEWHLLRATCALPLIFPTIKLDGVPYLDGGLSDPIPFKKALADGCDKVVVVLTREPGYQKETSLSTKAMAKAFSRYPAVAEDLLKRAKRYNQTLQELEKYEKEGSVLVIRPSHTKGFSRMEKDKNKLLALYDDGFSKGIRMGDRVHAFYRGE